MMRVTWGLAMVAIGFAAQPVWSEDGVPGQGSAASAASSASAVVQSGLMAISPRLLRFAIAPVSGRGPFADTEGRLQERINSSMIDFFPVSDQGIHLSVGMRLYARQNFARDAERATGGLLYVPRGRGVGGIGSRRFTPAATFGYSRALGTSTTLGLEGGAVMGRLNSGMSGRVSQSGSDSHGINGLRPVSGMNPMAHITFGYKF